MSQPYLYTHARKANGSACWKWGTGNLPAKDCAGPSPHPGLEVSPCKQGCIPAVPSCPLPQELTTCKNRVFSAKTKVPNEKEGK